MNKNVLWIVGLFAGLMLAIALPRMLKHSYTVKVPTGKEHGLKEAITSPASVDK